MQNKDLPYWLQVLMHFERNNYFYNAIGLVAFGIGQQMPDSDELQANFSINTSNQMLSAC